MQDPAAKPSAPVAALDKDLLGGGPTHTSYAHTHTHAPSCHCGHRRPPFMTHKITHASPDPSHTTAAFALKDKLKPVAWTIPHAHAEPPPAPEETPAWQVGLATLPSHPTACFPHPSLHT
jgi:hypothetical protein